MSEHGFTYPLTLCLLLLFLLFFSIQTERLLSERKLAHETAIVMQEEYYFLASVKKLEETFQTNGSLPVKGTYTYKKGWMDFQTEAPSGYTQRVTFTLSLNTGEKVTGRGLFDTRTKKLMKWTVF
ncbi:competence type IV pilus minor pilin ComGG [Neobacillus niacini]|uniref:competence type IV pilus minor pilin ComGG n=1 Tax=Neobacillus niacini TaxID=86668 RepID=UPI0021CB6969|nr:competence type IV pilus minor pilin ComGG [Neobacillus niacini]MCM3765262.1 ComGG family competence protein [Neobacillus niacini]